MRPSRSGGPRNPAPAPARGVLLGRTARSRSSQAGLPVPTDSCRHARAPRADPDRSGARHHWGAAGVDAARGASSADRVEQPFAETDLTEQAHTRQEPALAWERRGDDRRALDHARRALDLYRTLDQPVWEAEALNAMGWYAATTTTRGNSAGDRRAAGGSAGRGRLGAAGRSGAACAPCRSTSSPRSQGRSPRPPGPLCRRIVDGLSTGPATVAGPAVTPAPARPAASCGWELLLPDNVRRFPTVRRSR